jgi:hypothetical protein
MNGVERYFYHIFEQSMIPRYVTNGAQILNKEWQKIWEQIHYPQPKEQKSDD